MSSKALIHVTHEVMHRWALHTMSLQKRSSAVTTKPECVCVHLHVSYRGHPPQRFSLKWSLYRSGRSRCPIWDKILSQAFIGMWYRYEQGKVCLQYSFGMTQFSSPSLALDKCSQGCSKNLVGFSYFLSTEGFDQRDHSVSILQKPPEKSE